MMSFQLGLIGYPIKHSLSPWIHKKFLRASNLEGEYSIIEIDPGLNFADQMEKFKQNRIDGFNVTVPYKQKIISYLDHVDEEAQNIGAVNTVVNRNGKWTGYNTDSIGYVRSLEAKYPEAFTQKSTRILLIGAGGAARGIYYSLVSSGFKQIDIANRTTESAEKIAKHSYVNTNVLTLTSAERRLGRYDIIIQTTSVGMKPNEDRSIISLENLKESSIVSDIIYQPIKTKILSAAESKGASIHFGHTMLLYQAQYAFEIWTNQKMPVNDMDDQLKNILEGR